MKVLSLTAFLTGCTALPLSSVPITGGSEEQHAEVRAELDAFDGWVGTGRVTLSEIHLRELSDSIAGIYHRGSQKIELDSLRPLDSLRDTLRHELCHALDHEEHQMRGAEPTFDAQTDALYAWYEAQGQNPDSEPRSGSSQRGEVFASFCEVGPFAAVTLLETCSEAPVTELMSYMVEHVWTGSFELDVTGPSTRPPIHASFPVQAQHFTIYETRADDLIWVVMGEGEEQVGQAAELSTGEAWPGEVDLAVSEPDPAFLPGLNEITGYSVTSGRAAAIAEVNLHHLGWSTPRWFSYDGSWSLVDFCPPDARGSVFPAADELWAAWADEESLWWRPVVD